MSERDDPLRILGKTLEAQLRIDAFAGRGGYSVVYKGFHTKQRCAIAVRCVALPGDAGTAWVDVLADRVEEVSRRTYKLAKGCPTIPRCLGSGVLRGDEGERTPFVVSEWVDGVSLAAELDARRAVGAPGRSLDDTAKLLDGAARALAHAHEQGFVHGDVSPRSIFLCRAGPSKLNDFGLAHLLSQSDPGRAGAKVFAYAYAAPERFLASLGQVGAHSDVYSLALIVLHVLRGRPPISASSYAECALRAVDTTLPRTPRGLGITASQAVEDVFARATNIAPSLRFASAKQFWDTLSDALRDDPASMSGPAAEGFPSMTGAAVLALSENAATQVDGALQARFVSRTAIMPNAEVAAGQGGIRLDANPPLPPPTTQTMWPLGKTKLTLLSALLLMLLVALVATAVLLLHPLD